MIRPSWQDPGFRRLVIAGLGAVLVVVAAYGNHFENSFHFDDSHVIQDNLSIRSLANLPSFFADASTFSTLPDNQTYRPLLSATYAVDYAVGGGLDPTVFHVSQLLFHLLVGFGLFLVFKGILDRARPDTDNGLVALFAALWFCVHTANTETVNYLSARSDILSTLGVVASLAAYLHVPASRRAHLYLLPMLIGALAKPSAVIFAPLLLVYILLFEEELPLGDLGRRESGEKVWNAFLAAVPALVVGVAAFFFVEGMNPEGQSYGGQSRWGYLQTQLWVGVHYAKLFFLPVGLSADTDWTLIPQWFDTRIVAGLVGLVGLGVAATVASRHKEWGPVAFGLVWFVLGLLPSSSLFPLAEVANEHRLYLPFGGLALAVTWTVVVLARRGAGGRVPRGVVAAGLLVLAAHGIATVARNRVWLSEETLWSDVVVKSPENGRAWMNRGLTHMREGRLAEARADFEEAQRRVPNYPALHVNLGIVSGAQGDTAEADRHFARALELGPDYGPARHFYGRYLLSVGRGPEAINLLRFAMELMPRYAPPRVLLLLVYYVIGSRDEVRKLAEGTLAVAPGDSLATAYLEDNPPVDGVGDTPYLRGVSLTAQGRHLEAGVAYRRALEDGMSDPEVFLNLGWSQAMLGFDALAVISFQQALAERPGWALAEQNLRWVQGRLNATPAGSVVP